MADAKRRGHQGLGGGNSVSSSAFDFFAFVVVGEDDLVILKTIHHLSMKKSDALVKNARRQARTSKMKRSDITKAIARVRGRK